MSRYDDLRKRYQQKRQAAGMSSVQEHLLAQGAPVLQETNPAFPPPSFGASQSSVEQQTRGLTNDLRWHAILLVLDILAIAAVLLW